MKRRRFHVLAVIAVLSVLTNPQMLIGFNGGGGASPFAGALVLVTNWADDTVSLVDLGQEKELSTIKVNRMT